jgi:myo-inositol-1(or 4)-monophosphatase
VIYEPLRDEMFWAERGVGAYLNDRRLRVSARQHLKEAVMATGIPFLGRAGHEEFLTSLRAVMANCAGVRRFGSAALDLAYVAAGRYDGFWEGGLSIWDIAAGILLVREAGGLVSDLDGGDSMLSSGRVIAANNRLHGPLLELLEEARKSEGGT